MEKLKKYWQFKKVRLAVKFLLLAILILVSFQFGRLVGIRQAGFSFGLGNNYYQAFEGPHRGPGARFSGDLPGGHGAVGKVVEVRKSSLVISTPDNLEKTILITEKTSIKKFRNNATSTDFRVDDMVVVFGESNSDSQIEAKLIRLLPPVPLKK